MNDPSSPALEPSGQPRSAPTEAADGGRPPSAPTEGARRGRPPSLPTEPARCSRPPGKRLCGEVILIFCAALAAYFPAIRGAFIWNDSDYVTEPALRSLAGLRRIWFEVGATQQYYPALHTAFWIEHRWWGDAALGYHLVNVLLHATSACLFVAVLRRLRIPGAYFAGLLFALHPVCVESVAWISEQKNTLSTVFYLLAALVYLRWRQIHAEHEAGVGLGGRARPLAPSTSDARLNERSGATAQPYLYLVALALYVLAILSKSVAATLPAALLVVFWWQRGRLSWKRDVGPLLPWFVLGAAAGLFTGWVEHTYIGAKGDAFGLTLVQRTLVAGRAIWFYLGKLFWPAKLIFIYPRWNVDATFLWQYLFPLAALALLAGLWGWRRRSRAPLAAALIFIGTLFPTLGFFNIFAFIFSYVADHFQYLATLSVIALVAGAWGRWAESERGQVEKVDLPGSVNVFSLTPYLAKPAAAVPPLAAIAVLSLLGILTWRQSRMYRDVIAFYRTTLAENPNSWMGHHNLGVTLAEAGQMPAAIAEYQAALRLKPDDALAEYDLASAYFKVGRTAEALEHFQRSLQLEPNYVKAHYAMGNVLAQLGRIPEAIVHYQAALRSNPAYPEARYDLGNAFLATGRLREAIVEFRRAVELEPDYEQALSHLGGALVQAGQTGEAMTDLDRALRINPADAEAHYDIGIALAQSNRVSEAVGHFEAAARLEPEDPDAQVNLALALAEVGRIPEAIAHCQTALRLRPNFAPARELLGRLRANP